MARHAGAVVQWNNKGGYGFVRDDTGRDFYVHVSKLTAGGRPRIGDRLTFDIATGRKGRPSAINITISAAEPSPARPPRSSAPSRYTIGLRITAATMLTLLIVWAIASGYAPLWLALLYTLMGSASALLYRFDKIYAQTNRWRVSEANLHVVDLGFGIIGGLCAQEAYRHKTVKPRFVGTTWSIALFHTLVLAALSFGWLQAIVPLAS